MGHCDLHFDVGLFFRPSLSEAGLTKVISAVEVDAALPCFLGLTSLTTMFMSCCSFGRKDLFLVTI
jgi:hypothetical protein